MGPTWGRLLQDAATNGLGDHKPKRSKKSANRNSTVTGMSMSCLDRARTANFGYRKFTVKNQSNPSPIHDSNIFHPYWLSDLFMSWMFAIALLLKKPCLWGLCVQFSMVIRIAHMHRFICLVQCLIFWHKKFWISPGVEGNRFHVMSGWLQNNCLRILFRNVSQRWQVNLLTGLIHQTVKTMGRCQHKMHCQCANHFPDTSASLQAGHQHNLLQHHCLNLNGRWEGTSELLKSHSSGW